MQDHEARSLIWRHIAAMPTCMLVKPDNGRLAGKPMRSMPRSDDNIIWFIADKAEHSAEAMERDPHACLAYADPSQQNYVSVSGHIQVVEDRQTVRDLWTEGASLYFPQGPDDSNAILLKFVPDYGEYWDAPASKLVLAIKFVQAKITGDKPELGSKGATPMR